MADAREAAVVIVGAGPVGATAALLLARHGIASLIVDRKTEPQRHPAAHVLSTRTLEVWREIDLERPVRTASARLHELRDIVYCTTLGGVELGRVPITDPSLQAVSRIESFSPTRAAHLPQNRLERLLWQRLAATDGIEFRPGTAYESHVDDVDGVCVTLREAGRGAVSTRRARYLLAADGAASAVRHHLGIAMEGPVLQHVMSVHFAGRLQRYLRTRRGPVVWVHHRRCGIGTFIVHRPPDDWVYQMPYFPPVEQPQDFGEAACLERIYHAVGARDIPVQVKSVRPWVMTAQLAARYRSGNAFLIGDAAHRFPPTGGLGLNTGVHDAHNLAWKLAWVLRGAGPASWLDSYERERRPVADLSRAHSVRNFDQGFAVHTAMGLPPGGRRALNRLAGSSLVRRLPRATGRRLLRLAMAAGMRRLTRLEDGGRRGIALRRRVRVAIDEQRVHYRFWGLDLGYCYAEGMVVADGSPTHVLDVEHYVRTSRPGGRLPHAWVHLGGQRKSTLDLVDRAAFVLLTAASGSRRWQAAARAVRAQCALAVRCVALGADAVADPTGADVWGGVLGMPEDGALLVRPDGHIAWRATSAADATGALLRAVAMLQGPTVSDAPCEQEQAVAV